jgi:uncharacterized membrane protein
MTSVRDIVGVVSLALTTAVGVATYSRLPDPLVVQWSISGEPTSTMAKPLALVFIPALIAVVWAVFVVDYEIDPLRSNILQFAGYHDALAAIVMGFLAYVHVAIVVWNLGFEFGIAQAITPPIAVLLYCIGTVLPEAERNWFVGIRTPWTLSDETVWRRTHDRFGPLYKLAGLATLPAVVVPQPYSIGFLAGPAVVVSLAGVVYSLVIYRQVSDDGDAGPGPSEI